MNKSLLNEKYYIKKVEYETEEYLNDYLERLTLLIYGLPVYRLSFKDNNKFNLTKQNVSIKSI
tara:strand:- start:582 stop:770 length:189 start_codon:yes stop_codon:yes gene_type:complete